MNNLDLASDVLKQLWHQGVREVVLCAGARNAPLVSVLNPSPFQVFSFFEERSAAFFALGRSLDSRRPVAVVTTSGTAAAELLPATIEAFYQGVPLVLITADRPQRYRGSGAPQTIVQPGLFSHYVAHSFDLEGHAGEVRAHASQPVHINLCFDEPLLVGERPTWSIQPGEEESAQAAQSSGPRVDARAPLVIVSALPAWAADSVAQTLARWQRPLYLEAPSRLRGHPALSAFELRGGEASIKALQFDSVIRVGGVPTLRYWRDLENNSLPVWHFSHLPFSGLPRTREVFALDQMASAAVEFSPWAMAERAADVARGLAVDELFARFPQSEPALLKRLAQVMSADARLFLGNSLPIREWDLVAGAGSTRDVFANRGVNGIDGLTSTWLGLAHSTRENWCVLGDLSALYDLTGPWALRERPVQSAQVVVVNNGGGRIFHRIFKNPLFENAHGLSFEPWARMWAWAYACAEHAEQITAAQPGARVLELRPEFEQTQAFFNALEGVR